MRLIFFLRQRKAGILSCNEVSSSSASGGKDTSCFFLPFFRGWSWPQSIPRISKFSTFYDLSKIWRFNMGFNNGFEHVRLENKWKKLRIQYREAGMSEEAIQEMYNFDVQVVNSEQRYYRHSKDLAFNDADTEDTHSNDRYEEAILMADTYRETKSRFTWIGEIEDERLLSALEKLKEEDLKILTLYAYDGYNVTEISKVLRCSQPTISIKIKRITKFLKNFEFDAMD
jgi:RNA polymerase sigma factor (sigma-70 family)